MLFILDDYNKLVQLSTLFYRIHTDFVGSTQMMFSVVESSPYSWMMIETDQQITFTVDRINEIKALLLGMGMIEKEIDSAVQMLISVGTIDFGSLLGMFTATVRDQAWMEANGYLQEGI
jgi:hypothetical protein